MKKKFENSIDPDEAAHNELPHIDLHCLPKLISWNSQYDVAWICM